MSLALHYWMGDAHHCLGSPVSEMTYTVSSGMLNCTIPYQKPYHTIQYRNCFGIHALSLSNAWPNHFHFLLFSRVDVGSCSVLFIKFIITYPFWRTDIQYLHANVWITGTGKSVWSWSGIGWAWNYGTGLDGGNSRKWGGNVNQLMGIEAVYFIWRQKLYTSRDIVV